MYLNTTVFYRSRRHFHSVCERDNPRIPAHTPGADSGGGRAPPLKLEKIWFFGVNSWFFTRNTSKIFAPPSAIEKIWFFGVKSWFFTGNTPKIFAPPSARRNFFKCAPPLTWNHGSAPVHFFFYSNHSLHKVVLKRYTSSYHNNKL